MASKKLIITFVAALTAICLSMAGVTVAYFQNQTEIKINPFKMGSVDVSIDEEFTVPASGDYAIKKVALKNTGTIDAYLRAMLVPTFRSGSDSLACNVDYSAIGSGRVQVTTLDGARAYTLILSEEWDENWEFSHTDNVFYFRAKVPPGQLTTPLLAGVEKDADDWENLNIDVLANAVQAEGESLLQFLKDKWNVRSINPDGSLEW